ncbi:tape measure protein [Nesterenkonia sp. HG001]|uniref:tape measure protein n=1 Tax=Nesterenkonia sp. HG001 TaxID=2983207 RepID=UPI002AC59993|nr:tape measure protein [Nesterenkonia sp. HG001]MDZ5076732.1 tape measure protein [Nesterenkonia sp. HG001]
MAQESVSLVVEVQDRATAALDQVNKSIDDTARKVDKASKDTGRSTRGLSDGFDRASQAVHRSTTNMGKALQRFTGGGSTALRRFTSGVGDRFGQARESMSRFTQHVGSSETRLGRFLQSGRQGLRNFATGFRDSNAAASTFTGRMGSLGGVMRTVSDRAKSIGSSAASGLGAMRRYLSDSSTMGGRVVSSIGGIASAAGRAGSAIASRVTSALSSAASTATKIVGIVGGIAGAAAIGGGVSRAMNIEDTEARLRGLGRGADEIESLMGDASDAIWGTAYRLDEAAGVAATFSAAGVEGGDDMQRMLSLVGDNAFAAGQSFEEMGNIWGRVAAYGRLDTQTMNQMMDRQIPILDGITEHYGITQDAAREMVTNGEIDLNAFADIMENVVGGAAQEMATTTRGAFTNVQAGAMMLGEQVVGPLMQIFRGAFNALQEILFASVEVISPVFEVLTERATDWAEAFGESGIDVADRIRTLVEPMEDVAELMRDGVPLVEAFAEAFDIDLSDGLLGTLVDLVQTGLELSPLAGIVRGLADAGAEVGEAFSGAFGVIMDTVGEVAPIIGDAFADIGRALAPLLATAATTLAGLIEAVLPVVMEVVAIVADLLADLLPVITEVAGELAGALLGVLEALLPALLPIVDVVADLLLTLAPIVGDLVVALLPVLDIVGELAGVLVALLAPILDQVAHVLGVVAEFAVDLVIALLPLVEVVLDVAVQLIEALLPGIEAILKALEPLLPIFLDLLLVILTPLIGVITFVAEVIADVLVWALELLAPVLEWVADGLEMFASWLGDKLGDDVDIAGGAVQWFTDTLEWLGDIFEPILDDLGEAWEWLAEVIPEVWEDHLEPALDEFGNFLLWLWEDVADPTLSWILDKWDELGLGVSDLWENVLQPTIETLGGVIVWLWENVVSPYLSNVWGAWQTFGRILLWVWDEILWPTITTLGDTIQTLWTDYVSPALTNIGDAWETLSSTLSHVWETYIKPIFQAVGDFVNDELVPRVESGLELITDIWEGIKAAFADPVNFVIDTVWNDGLRVAWNTVAGLVPGMSELDAVPTVNAYAKGGTTERGLALVGEEGPELVWMGGGEYVSTASETRELLTQSLVDSGQDVPAHMESDLLGNSPAESLLPAGDGFWSGVIEGAGNIVSTIGDALGSLADWSIGSLVSNAKEAVFGPVMSIVEGAVSDMGGFGDIITGFAEMAIDGLTSIFGGHDDSASEGGVMIEGEFEGARGTTFPVSHGPVTSRYGPRWGSHHAGIDIAGGGPVFSPWNGIVAATGSNIGPGRTGLGVLISHGDGIWSYTGHHPVGGITVSPGQEVSGGQRIGAQGATGNVTGIHTHAEIHKGRPWADVNPAPYLLRDEGGILPPGLSQVLNLTGGPEYILNRPQFDTVADLLDLWSQAPAAPEAPDAPIVPAPTSAGGGDTIIYERNVTIEEGAFQFTSTGTGDDAEELYDAVKEALEEVLERSEERDYA